MCFCDLMSAEWREPSLYENGQPKWVPNSTESSRRRQKELEQRPVVQRRSPPRQHSNDDDVSAAHPKDVSKMNVPKEETQRIGTVRQQQQKEQLSPARHHHQRLVDVQRQKKQQQQQQRHVTSPTLIAASLKRRMLALKEEKGHMETHLQQAVLLDTLFVRKDAGEAAK